MKNLYEKLDEYSKSDFIPMHMPGHKRNRRQFAMGTEAQIDITEIDGFDDYHYPEGIILEAEKKAAKIYGARDSFYLVNGSSSGLLAAISCVCEDNKSIGIARNSHKAVYNGVLLNRVMPVYIYPEIDHEYNIMGCISPKAVEEVLNNENVSAILITSPTYEGVVSDVEKIADICHCHKVPLIVDAAHGAHFNFHKEFPKTAIESGADIVIESIHKTLPCYTQTAIIHVGKDALIDTGRLQKYLSIYQTTSPSYIFMSGINKCIDYMISDEGKRANEKYVKKLTKLRKSLEKLKNIKIYYPKGEVFDYDISKIVLYSQGNGTFIHDKLLMDYHIQIEMTAADYIIAMTSIGDRQKWYKKFIHAMKEIDEQLDEFKIKEISYEQEKVKAKVGITPYEADCANKQVMKLFHSEGHISAEMLYAYPPGIPIIYPGEVITAEIIEQIKRLKQCGIKLKGPKDLQGEEIICIK